MKKRCFGFVQSRMELANKGVGSLARDVAMSCLPLYSTWLQPAKFTSLSKTLQSAGVAALSPMAEFSYADFHNCVMPLLLLETNADATKTSVLPALLTVLREHTQMKCDVPDKIISEYEAALLSAYNTLPSPLTVSGPKVSVDTHLLASLRAVAGALFHIYERKGTLNTAIQTLLAQPLVKGSCTAPSKTIFTTCTLVRDRFVPMKALGACRKWCGDIDRRNASLHVTAIACAAEVAATVRARDGGTDKALWIENAFDTLLAGAPGSLALPTMLEGALSLAPFHVLCRRPHTKRLTVAASAGRCSDCLLNGYLPLELAKAVAASTKGGKADKIVGKIASLAVHCSAEKSVLEVPMARMLLDAIISNNNPAHPVDSQLLKWL